MRVEGSEVEVGRKRECLLGEREKEERKREEKMMKERERVRKMVTIQRSDGETGCQVGLGGYLQFRVEEVGGWWQWQ